MNTTEFRVNLWDLTASLAKAIDMMSPEVGEHHLRVAYLALRIADELRMPVDERRDLVLASALHDVGAFSLSSRLDLLAFEDEKPTQHSVAGYLLLKDFKPFEKAASLIRFHHLPWMNGTDMGTSRDGISVPMGSHLIHLADRVAVLIAQGAILGQAAGICETIERGKGRRFVPEYVDAFVRAAAKDVVWLEVTSDLIPFLLKKHVAMQDWNLDLDMLLSFSRLICRVIDFKSEFTATHSSGVAAVAVALAQRTGFSELECRMVEIAAYLHDLGKLAVPSEIIEKPSKLTLQEWQVMRTHVYYTHHILSQIEALDIITQWSALHQERLNGTGYPFCYTEADLPMGSRLMAVADVFTGITEDRPYRKAMSKEEALGVLYGMAGRHELDATLVAQMGASFDAINAVRAKAQQDAAQEYQAFRDALK